MRKRAEVELAEDRVDLRLRQSHLDAERAGFQSQMISETAALEAQKLQSQRAAAAAEAQVKEMERFGHTDKYICMYVCMYVSI
jgi:hypothetical protein